MTNTRKGSVRRLIVASCLPLVAALPIASCRSGEGEARSDSPEIATTTSVPVLSFDELISERSCTEPPAGDTEIGPIGGDAATRVAVCEVTGATVHVFERAPLEPPPGLEVSGTIENIERNVGAGIVTPGCDVVVWVSDRYFVIAPGGLDLGVLSNDLGAPVRPVVAASPTVSYLPPDCELWR